MGLTNRLFIRRLLIYRRKLANLKLNFKRGVPKWQVSQKKY